MNRFVLAAKGALLTMLFHFSRGRPRPAQDDSLLPAAVHRTAPERRAGHGAQPLQRRRDPGAEPADVGADRIDIAFGGLAQ
jgi:hypothetical protein